MHELIQEFRDEKKMHCMEGSRGVGNLCNLVRAIGYRDAMNRMQYGDGCLGDLLMFLEDNSGAIEAIITWIGDQDIQDWKDNLESELPECDCPNCDSWDENNGEVLE